MRKIPSLFARDAQDPSKLTRDYHPLAAWIVRGEGVATRKWDGTAVLVRDAQVFARFDAKRGKAPPPGFVAAQDPDPITGHHPGWVPATRPEDVWIREAAEASIRVVGALADGTYEACGPKIGANRERLPSHQLIRHGQDVLSAVPIDWDGLVAYFTEHDVEGVVWWRDALDVDCDKVKITGAAMGVRRLGRPGKDRP